MFGKIRQFILILTVLALPIFFGGCRLGQFKPVTPSQLFSGELSRAGNAAMEKGDWAEAEKKLEEAVKLNKKDAELRRHYAEALWIRGKHEQSLQQLLEAIKRGGADDPSLHLSLAEKYLSIEQHAMAYYHADQAVQLAPQEYKGRALRGRAGWFIAEKQKNSDSPEKVAEFMTRARNDYYRALSLSPDSAREVLPELAAVQMLCGQPEQALASWQNLEGLFPPDNEPADLLRGKAESYIALRRFNDAADCLQKARIREPGRPEIERRLQEVVAMRQNVVR